MLTSLKQMHRSVGTAFIGVFIYRIFMVFLTPCDGLNKFIIRFSQEKCTKVRLRLFFPLNVADTACWT